MDADLRKFLLTVNELTLLVGERIYLVESPQGTAYPVVVIPDIRDEYQIHAGGTLNLRPATARIEVFGRKQSDAAAVARAIAEACNGYQGLWDDIEVRFCRATVLSDPEVPLVAAEQGLAFREVELTMQIRTT